MHVAAVLTNNQIQFFHAWNQYTNHSQIFMHQKSVGSIGELSALLAVLSRRGFLNFRKILQSGSVCPTIHIILATPLNKKVDGLQDCCQFRPTASLKQGRQTITSHLHADHQIDRKERNQPCMKVLGLEKRSLIVPELTRL